MLILAVYFTPCMLHWLLNTSCLPITQIDQSYNACIYTLDTCLLSFAAMYIKCDGSLRCLDPSMLKHLNVSYYIHLASRQMAMLTDLEKPHISGTHCTLCREYIWSELTNWIDLLHKTWKTWVSYIYLLILAGTYYATYVLLCVYIHYCTWIVISTSQLT